MKDAPIALTTQEIPRHWEALSLTLDHIYFLQITNYTYTLTFKVLVFKEMLTNRECSVTSGKEKELWYQPA